MDAALAGVHALVAPAVPLETPPLDMREVTVNGVTRTCGSGSPGARADHVTGHPVLAVPSA